MSWDASVYSQHSPRGQQPRSRWLKYTAVVAKGRRITDCHYSRGCVLPGGDINGESWVVFDKSLDPEDNFGAVYPLSYHETADEACREIERLYRWDRLISRRIARRLR